MNEKSEKTFNIEICGIDEATEKAIKLVELLKEASSLANEIASMNYKLIGKD